MSFKNNASRGVLRDIQYQLAHCLRHVFVLVHTLTALLLSVYVPFCQRRKHLKPPTKARGSSRTRIATSNGRYMPWRSFVVRKISIELLEWRKRPCLIASHEQRPSSDQPSHESSSEAVEQKSNGDRGMEDLPCQRQIYKGWTISTSDVKSLNTHIAVMFSPTRIHNSMYNTLRAIESQVSYAVRYSSWRW